MEKSLVIEKLRSLDYGTLEALEGKMLRSWNCYTEKIEKYDDLSIPSIDRDLGITKKQLQQRSDYYFSAHALCLDVIQEFEDRIFGPAPELMINKNIGQNL